MPRTISVAMIVKDESAGLAECLAAVAGLADEISVVDTGSRDDTIALVRQYGAKVSFFIWCDDSSAARNEALRSCTKDWVLVLDANERIVPGDFSAIRALAEGPVNSCYRFTTRNYTNSASVKGFRPCDRHDAFARDFAGWYPTSGVRLFPNKIGAQSEGVIHETVHKSIEQKNIKIVDCDIVVHHYPYVKTPEGFLAGPETSPQTNRPPITDSNALAKLAGQYAETRDFANAAASYRELLRINPSNPGAWKDLGGALHMLKRGEEAKKALQIALELDPGLIGAWRNLGTIFGDEKDWPMAIECFNQAIATEPGWADGYRCLGMALAGAARLPEAAAATQKALEINPASKETLTLYIHQMLRLEQRQEARQCLLAFEEKGAANPEIQNALGELCFYDELYEEAKDHFLKAGREGITSAYNNLGVVLYKQGKYAEARDAFENCLATDPGHRGALTNLQRTLVHLNSE